MTHSKIMNQDSFFYKFKFKKVFLQYQTSLDETACNTLKTVISKVKKQQQKWLISWPFQKLLNSFVVFADVSLYKMTHRVIANKSIWTVHYTIEL